MSLDKYSHLGTEDEIYSYWEKNNLFKPVKNKKKFSVVIPPPNVTGSLHMGHALNNSLQDVRPTGQWYCFAVGMSFCPDVMAF